MNEDKLEQELRDHFQAETNTIEPTLDWWIEIFQMYRTV